MLLLVGAISIADRTAGRPLGLRGGAAHPFANEFAPTEIKKPGPFAGAALFHERCGHPCPPGEGPTADPASNQLDWGISPRARRLLMSSITAGNSAMVSIR